MKKILLAVAAACVLSGCQSLSITPSDVEIAPGEVCILPDTSNRKIAYECTIKALEEKGFTVKPVTIATASGCQTIISCQSVSRWDMANFTQHLNFEITHEGKIVARSTYHHKGGLAFTKYINTQEKVNQMLNAMLPNTRHLPSRYE